MKSKSGWYTLLFAAILLLTACQSAPTTEPAPIDTSPTPDEPAACKQILYQYHVPLSGVGRPLYNLVSGCPYDTERRILTSDVYGAAWSPDGSEIAFISDRSGTYQLHLMLPDGSNVRQLTFGPDLINSEWFWMPDGERIALLIRPPIGGCCEEDEDQSDDDYEQPTEEAIEPAWQVLDLISLELSPFPGWTVETFLEHYTIISNDRTRLAYEVYSEEFGGHQIHIQNFDGSDTYALIVDIPVGHVTWYPDDSHLAFTMDLSGTHDQFTIFAINVDGTGLTRLTEHAFDRGISFIISPDGASLAITDGESVYMLDLETDELTRLFYLEYPSSVGILSWQP